ncbi:MAG TPA: hypothetical protein VFT17_11000, partial [Propionibacteriaceae bacterium]|nr:hypothetical protein [Propionibacteriaceae bacterium]
MRFTDQPQRWAAAPALLMGLGGLLLVGFGHSVQHVTGLPPRSRAEARASAATANNVRSTIEEYVQASASMEQAASLRDFADNPLIVLTAGSGHGAAWFAAQNDMATLSTNSVHRVIDATHQSLIAHKEGAAATTRAILDVVASVRS